MATTIIRLRLLLAAYAPLFLLLALRFSDCWLVGSCLLLALVGVASGWRLVSAAQQRAAPDPIEVAWVEDRGADVAGFLATYLLPFLTVDEPGWRDIAAYIGFFLIVAVVYIRSRMVQINPTLYLMGWRLNEIRTTGGWQGFALSRHTPEAGNRLMKTHLASDVVVVRDRKD